MLTGLFWAWGWLLTAWSWGSSSFWNWLMLNLIIFFRVTVRL